MRYKFCFGHVDCGLLAGAIGSRFPAGLERTLGGNERKATSRVRAAGSQPPRKRPVGSLPEDTLQASWHRVKKLRI